MKAVIDVDGVLADFEGALVATLAEQFGDEMHTFRRDVYSLEERYKDNYGKVWAAADEFLNRPSSYGTLDPIDNGITFVNDLISRGWDVMFLSSRPQFVRAATERWLCWFVEDYYNTRGVLVGVNDKEVVAKEWGADILIDDNPETVMKTNAIGVNSFVWDQSWNKGVFPRLECERSGMVYVCLNDSTEEVPFFSVYDYAEV